MSGRQGYLNNDGSPNMSGTRRFLATLIPGLLTLRPLIESGALVLVPSEKFFAANTDSIRLRVRKGCRSTRASRRRARTHLLPTRRTIATAFERETPLLVTATMAKARRDGKVFIDWSQNKFAKTTISPYSLGGRDAPTVATPVTWDEVRGCRTPEQLMFTARRRNCSL